MIEIYTDGSFLGKSKKAGIGIHFPNKEFEDVSERYEDTVVTNQRAELVAILVALKICLNSSQKIKIYTDSKYCINCLTIWCLQWQKNGWLNSKKETVKNKDLITRILKVMKKYQCVLFEHVKGHSGNTKNEIADRLAVKGAFN